MAFEQWIKPSREHRVVETFISIVRGGSIGINTAAVREFKLERYTHVFLYWDEETNRIGIMPTTIPEARGAIPLRHHDSAASFGAYAFLRERGLMGEKTKRYLAYWDDDENMIVADVGGGDDS